MKYELHNDLDADFPVIFGYRLFSVSCPKEAYFHWHDCIELIYCETGCGWVFSSPDRIFMQEGDIIIINSGNIHDVFTESECGVYSLDLGNALFAPFGLKPEQHVFQEKIRDVYIEAAIKQINKEMDLKKAYYKQAVHAESISIVIKLIREYLRKEEGQRGNGSQHVEAVKHTLSYLREHFLDDITMDALCDKTGYNKFYLCHVFKKATGITIMQYVNFLRCQNARSLLLGGSHKVNESAAMSGFKNDSYFTKTYKAVFGKLPSEELKKAGS